MLSNKILILKSMCELKFVEFWCGSYPLKLASVKLDFLCSLVEFLRVFSCAQLHSYPLLLSS